MPASPAQLDPEATPLTMVQTGPKPFIDVQTRLRLDRRLRTQVFYCIDAEGAVVYSEIRDSSRDRTFDEQVRDYFAKARFEPYKDGDGPRAACTSAALTYEEPRRGGGVGRPAASLTATRDASYLEDCSAFDVVDGKVVCAPQSSESQRVLDAPQLP